MLLAAMFILGGLCFAGLGLIALCAYAEIVAIKKQVIANRKDLLQLFLFIREQRRALDKQRIDSDGNVEVNLN